MAKRTRPSSINLNLVGSKPSKRDLKYSAHQMSRMLPVNIHTLRKGMRLIAKHSQATVILANEFADQNGMLFIASEDGRYLPPASADSLLVEPLAWVEDQPVYKGMRLYCSLTGELCEAVQRDENLPGENLVCNMLEGRYSCPQFVGVKILTWDRPKHRRPMYLLVYPKGETGHPHGLLFSTREEALAYDTDNRHVDCVEVEIWLGDGQQV